jgi:hypothetical protein
MNATMASERLYIELDTLDAGMSRLHLMYSLKFMNHPFPLEPQPDAVIQRFYEGGVPAKDVANMFVYCFGQIIICREASYQAGRHMTILDCLEDQLNMYSGARTIERIVELIEAFANLNLRNAEWYDAQEIDDLYLKDPIYGIEDPSSLEPDSEEDGEEEDWSDAEDWSDIEFEAQVMPISA